MKKLIGILIVNCFFITNVFSADRVVNLTVAYKNVCFAGKSRKAIAVNNQVPAPTLHFKQGDHVVINVYNHLDQETAIHWHGILVPWQMDGVLGVSQQGIPPGSVFHYEFTLHQSGTYWYHSHAGLQEQQGLYGAFIIDPDKKTHTYDKGFVIVLSDWSNTNPDQILANLKKDGDYYDVRFPLQPSLSKFIHDYRHASHSERQLLVKDYLSMQKMRMSIYDISDVAYDAFLLNGKPNCRPWQALVKVGDKVRLRFIGASAGTIFHVKIPNTTLQMVQADGNYVRPYSINDFSIAPGETFDVILTIRKNQPYIIYAEAADTVGAAYGALVTMPNQVVDYQAVPPFPEPLPVTREMMANMNHEVPAMHGSMNGGHSSHMQSSMNSGHGSNMNHGSSMAMTTEASVMGDKISVPTSTSYTTSTATKYQPLIAAVKTNDPNKPIAGVIKMDLFGYMDRFIWFINGVPEYLAKPIVLNPGKRYRIIFTNNSMMHHPMHIHGHWFILRKGNGAYDPLLHTIDVPPGATMTADIDTDASGQWFFHCHLLYHMISGMARIFQYSTLLELAKGEIKPEYIIQSTPYVNRPIVRVDEVRPLDISLIHHPMAHPKGFWWATFLEVAANPFDNFQTVTYKGLYGPDYHKLELFMNDAEANNGVENADLDIFYWHPISQFWAVKGGVNYFYRPATSPYWQPGMGIEGLMPFFIDTDVRAYYYGGSAKLDIELNRDTQITNNFFIGLDIRSILASKTVNRAEIGSGLNQMQYTITPYYRLIPGLNIFAQYEHQSDYGAFKHIQQRHDESTVENTFAVGLMLTM